MNGADTAWIMAATALVLFMTIHNIELRPGQGGVLVRSAGAYAQLMAKDGKYAIVKLASGEVRMILQTCLATIGSVSNSEHSLQNSGKAGRSRWLGRRPRTRPVAMNPVDHPMGFWGIYCWARNYNREFSAYWLFTWTWNCPIFNFYRYWFRSN